MNKLFAKKSNYHGAVSRLPVKLGRIKKNGFYIKCGSKQKLKLTSALFFTKKIVK